MKFSEADIYQSYKYSNIHLFKLDLGRSWVVQSKEKEG
ncbi:MAG: hypothetical protein UZ09_BCD002000210 [Bacteroidetes bacterium OLB9]|nr:MAG: hypothetical protein UZ09_BCD002000210 [Bacteroidetes bacterium OLB9]